MKLKRLEGASLFAGMLILVALYACSPKAYKSTNKSYKKQVKAFGELLKKYPLNDSTGLPYAENFVGTTNLSMRRPNYVIIHHTAQNSCEVPFLSSACKPVKPR